MEDRKILTEVYEILKYISEEDFNKIPDEVIKLIEENKDNDYMWKYNDKVSLIEQNMSRGTVAVLTYINMKYLLDSSQRKVVEDIIFYNQKKEEEAKKEKYSSNEIFKKVEFKNTNENEKALANVKKENKFAKILSKIKYLFQK